MISEEKIKEVVEKIVVNYHPDKIILFGSYARGNPTENSDLDLLIVKDSKIPPHRRGIEVRKFLYGTLVPMDIIVYTNDEIEESRDIEFSFVNEVLNSGKVIYAKSN